MSCKACQSQPPNPGPASSPIGIELAGRFLKEQDQRMTDEPENLTLALLREMRAEIQERDERILGELADIRSDMREVKLAVALLEVRTGKMAERLEKIEKRLGMLPA